MKRLEVSGAVRLIYGSLGVKRLMGLSSDPPCRRCGQRMKPLPTLSVSVMLWVHPDMYIWAPFSWIQKTLKVEVWGTSETLAKEQGSHEMVSDYGAKRAHQLRPRCIGA